MGFSPSLTTTQVLPVARSTIRPGVASPKLCLAASVSAGAGVPSLAGLPAGATGAGEGVRLATVDAPGLAAIGAVCPAAADPAGAGVAAAGVGVAGIAPVCWPVGGASAGLPGSAAASC